MTWTSFSILNFDRPFWEVENICMSFKTRLRYNLKCSIVFYINVMYEIKKYNNYSGLSEKDALDLNNDLVRLIYYCLFTYLSRWGWFLIARAIYPKKMNGNKLWNNLQPLRHSLYHLHEYNLWLESRNNKLFYYECKLYLYMKFYWMWQKGLEGAVNSMYLNKKSYSEWFLPWWVQFPGILNVIFKVRFINMKIQ